MDKIKGTLHSYWEIFLESVPRIAIALIILVVFILIGLLISRTLRKRVLHNSESPLVANFIVRLIKVVFVLAGLILAINALGFKDIAGGLLAGAGVGAIVLGFAFKEIGENFLAGIILVFNRPFSLGDTITINDNIGVVKELTFRTTKLKTFDGKDVYIPNSDIITNTLYNHTEDGFLRQDFVIGIDYDDDIDKAVVLITDVVNAHPEILTEEKTQVLVDEFGTNTVNLQILFWTKTKDYKVGALQVKFEVMRDVKRALSEGGFGMPANIQEVKLYRDAPIQVELKSPPSE
jgi:small-conductance mechanosensitive channel